MAIVKMKKIRLLALRSQKEAILRELMLLGCVEVSEPDELLSDPDISDAAKRETVDVDSLRSKYASLTRSIELVKQYAPKKTSIFALRPEISQKRLLDEESAEKAVELAKNIEILDNRIRRLVTEENNETANIESLRPWIGLGLSLNSEGTKQAGLLLGSFPITVDLDTVNSALWEVAPESQAFSISIGTEQHCVSIVYLKSVQQEISDTLRRFGFSQNPLKSVHGTAEENIKKAEEKIRSYQEEKNDLIARIVFYANRLDEIKLCCDHFTTQISRAEAEDKLVGTKSSIILTGWLEAPRENDLAATLERYVCAWELEDPLPEETEKVPIALKNNRLTKPLMMVTEMYSLPTYDGIDPNPLIMPFFTIFFGIMYADMGYGALLLIIGLLGSKLLKPRGTMKYAMGLFVMCGITSFIFGFLFGGFFGDLIPVVTGVFGSRRVELWSMIDPLKEPMIAMVASLAIGALQIFVGMAINAYMLIRDGKWFDALCDVGSWWLLFIGIALGATGNGWYICIAGAAALVLTQGRAKPTIIGKVISGLASLYDITAYLGDILSYTRLMALLMAGSVIGSVFNMLGSMPGTLIVFIPVFLLGHALNMGLNIIGTYVHSARLQYLEFFGKFYKDGGRAFAPLQIKTKYYDMIKEED